ncbi:hypothetical protein [Spartinivicinus ruber]|uniref:hypothetical protein n=1 Tax=Spartinivicinus ruber TaxID=2683272 RepID=UPI0013D2E750|nr:hypothetical protein [Spartinivicinus ruber]
MILECEGKKSIVSPTEKQLINTLKTLKSHGPSSFASLTVSNGDYVQVAGGRMTCMLEKREGVSQYRAYHDNPSTPFPDGTILSFSAGDIPLKNDEWFNIGEAIDAFTCFLKKNKLPTSIKWRKVEL